jgi:hypothetical protein
MCQTPQQVTMQAKRAAQGAHEAMKYAPTCLQHAMPHGHTMFSKHALQAWYIAGLGVY